MDRDEFLHYLEHLLPWPLSAEYSRALSRWNEGHAVVKRSRHRKVNWYPDGVEWTKRVAAGASALRPRRS
eukprot:1034736-Prymnesium_polylepis.1